MEDIVKEINQLVCIVQELDKVTRRKKVVTNDTTLNGQQVQEQVQVQVQEEQIQHHLSHYTIQQIPESLKEILNFLYTVVTNINTTVTKITLLKHAQQEQIKLCTIELVPYCQHLSSVCLTITSSSNNTSTNNTSSIGCCLSMKQYYIRSIYSILLSIVRLVTVFCINSSDDVNNNIIEDNVGAPETGAVWDVCSIVLEKKLPTCNRASMRRDLLTFQQDCNDTINEFDELISMGPKIVEDENEEDEQDDDDDDDDQQEEQQYTQDEISIVIACIGLLKCSKNCLLLTATICDAAAATMSSPSNDTSTTTPNDAAILSWIGQFHEVSYLVGIGVTDLGSCLYPPLIVNNNNRINNDLLVQINQQIQLLENVVTFLNTVLPVSLESSSLSLPSSLSAAAASTPSVSEETENVPVNAVNEDSVNDTKQSENNLIISDGSGSSSMSHISMPAVTGTAENNNDTITTTTTTSVAEVEDDLINLTISNDNNNNDNKNDDRFIINFPNTVQEQIKKLQQAIQIRKQNISDALVTVVGSTISTGST